MGALNFFPANVRLVDARGLLTPEAARIFSDAFRRMGGAAAPSNSELDTGLTGHIADLDNPHQTDKAQVGLGNADNTSDLDKPISTATQAALDEKVEGPASATDNTLARYNGTSGKAVQGSGVLLSDDDEISGFRGKINAQTGTTYTLVAADTGKIVEITNAAAITLTLPNSLPVGWECVLAQGGAGQVTLSAATGATLRNRQSHTKLAGQWAMASLYVRANSGAAAEYVLCGDTSA